MGVELTPAFPEAMTWPEQARALKIVDAESYALAANKKLDLAALRKRIEVEFAPMKKSSYDAWKTIVAKEKEHLDPVTEAEGIIVAGIKRFAEEQERIRIAEQRRLQEEQRQREEADRLRREAEAKAIRDEELRVAAEIKARDEELRLSAALNAGTEAEAQAILATPLLEVPEVEPVEAYIEPAVYEAPVVAAPTYEKVKGLGIRETWLAHITNMRALCRAVADGTVPETYVTGNMTALNSRARSDKQLMKIPGVTAVKG